MLGTQPLGMSKFTLLRFCHSNVCFGKGFSNINPLGFVVEMMVSNVSFLLVMFKVEATKTWSKKVIPSKLTGHPNGDMGMVDPEFVLALLISRYR